jgi:acyl-CoA thioester hydrolase
MPALKTHEVRIGITPDDLPEDRFSSHVNNARYFAFINRVFQEWYVKMGIREPGAKYTAMMLHTRYDFLEQVFFPGTVLCRITVVKVGRSSMEHAVEMWNVSDEPRLAGRGRVVHAWVERAIGKSQPWPADVLSRCWAGVAGATAQPPVNDRPA